MIESNNNNQIWSSDKRKFIIPPPTMPHTRNIHPESKMAAISTKPGSDECEGGEHVSLTSSFTDHKQTREEDQDDVIKVSCWHFFNILFQNASGRWTQLVLINNLFLCYFVSQIDVKHYMNYMYIFCLFCLPGNLIMSLRWVVVIKLLLSRHYTIEALI